MYYIYFFTFINLVNNAVKLKNKLIFEILFSLVTNFPFAIIMSNDSKTAIAVCTILHTKYLNT